MKRAIGPIRRRGTAAANPALAPLPLLPPHLANQGMALRPQLADDRDFLRALFGSQRAAGLLLAPWSAEEKARFLDEQFRLQSQHFARVPHAELLVIERRAPRRAAEPVGRLYLDRSARDWRLLEIALTPAMQRRGIGTALVEWLHAAARSAGAGAIDLHVAIDNPRAEALYRRLGYVETASAWPTHRRMRRTLAD